MGVEQACCVTNTPSGREPVQREEAQERQGAELSPGLRNGESRRRLGFMMEVRNAGRRGQGDSGPQDYLKS